LPDFKEQELLFGLVIFFRKVMEMPKGVYEHKPCSEEHKRKIGEKLKGKPSKIKGRRYPKEEYPNFGMRGKHPSKGTKEKQIKSRIEYFEDPKNREKQREAQNRPEVKARQIRIHKELWQDPEYRKKWSGENSFSWRGGISFEPYSVDWTETLRRSIRERDHYICQLCSKYGNTVHHIDYDKKNCNPTNLITLCGGCNSKVNSSREYWSEYFSRGEE